MRLVETIYVAVNGLRNRLSARQFPPESILLLLPRCLQHSDCEIRLKGDLSLCRGCGRCKLKAIKALADSFGVKTLVATGGREAARRAKENGIQAVVAIACQRELAEGIRAVFPKRVFGVPNSWPCGECVDTEVDVADVERALRRCIRFETRRTGIHQ